MKTHRIEFLSPAVEDLKLIEDYYNMNFGGKSGKKLVGKIIKAIKKLKQYPSLGVMIRDKELSNQGYRTIFVDNFVVVYRVIGEMVYIYHVANTQQEYALMFKDD